MHKIVVTNLHNRPDSGLFANNSLHRHQGLPGVSVLAALVLVAGILTGCSGPHVKSSEGNCLCTRPAMRGEGNEEVFCEQVTAEEVCAAKCFSSGGGKARWFGPNRERGFCASRFLDLKSLLGSMVGSGAEKTPAKNEPPKVRPPAISTTVLQGIFRKHQWNGKSQLAYPVVTVTIRDASDSTCYVATAVVWKNAKTSENVGLFSACGADSRENALLEAKVNGERRENFVRQVAVAGHTGNVRTTGPKSPVTAIPGELINQAGMTEFIGQLVTSTGWTPGGGMRLWITGDAPDSPDRSAAMTKKGS